MQRGMIEYQRIAGLQFGHDAIRRREMFGDPFVRKDAGFGRRQLTHAPMRAAHQLAVLTFFSTLVDNRGTMSVIEPLAQSDRANSNSCFSD